MVTDIKHFHLGEQWFRIIDNLEELFITKQVCLNLDQKLSLRAQIRWVTTHNCSMSPICQPSSNGISLQFQLFKPSGIVNIDNWKEQHFTQSMIFLFLCMWIDLAKWTDGQLTYQWWTYRTTCLCVLRILSFYGNFQTFFNQRVLLIRYYWRNSHCIINRLHGSFRYLKIVYWCWWQLPSALALVCGSGRADGMQSDSGTV
jgi:hypothetical protein